MNPTADPHRSPDHPPTNHPTHPHNQETITMATTPTITKKLLAVLAIAALGFAACGSDPAPISSASANDGGDAATTIQSSEATGGLPAVTSADSSLGDILVGANGLTVYGFTNDVDAQSACYGTCAEAWPPVIVGADWDVAPDLDAGIFNAVVRDDGQLQLVAGKWPLYYFAGDAVPGDLNGQGSGDVWFAIGTDGILVTVDEAAGGEAAPAAAADDAADPASESDAGASIVDVGSSELGDVLVDEAGLTLYGFLDDADSEPTCSDACADAWPPLLVDGPELPAGLDPEVYSVVERPDGSFQLRAGTWPLYRFAGDAGPGDINGQGSGDVWFAATPGGGLIRLVDEGEESGGDSAPTESTVSSYGG